VADRDVVFAEENLAHDESDDLLALLDREVLGAGRQPRPERVERFGELEVGLGVVQLGVQSVQLGAQGRLAFAARASAGVRQLLGMRGGCEGGISSGHGVPGGLSSRIA
jgi:hypothetical protein